MDHRGDGAPPEGAAEARSAPPIPAEPPPQVQQTDVAHPAINSPPSTLLPNTPWAPTTVRAKTALPEHTPPAVAENDPPPWVWVGGQHTANPAMQAIDPAWAAYWANQAQPPAPNSAPVAHNGQYPVYSPVIAPPVAGAINRNKELLAFLIGVAVSVGVAILALAGYLIFGRGESSLVIPTAAIAEQPVVQATSMPTRVVSPTVVLAATTARAPSAVVPVGTATIATVAIATTAIATTAIPAPTLAVHAQAPFTIPVILPPTIAAGAVATPTAPARALPVVLTPSVNAGVLGAATAPPPAIPATLPPAVPAETRPSVPPTPEPSTPASPSATPLSPFVPRPAVPKPAPAVSSVPPSATPLSPFVPRPAAPQPVPTTPTLPTSPPPTPTISPPATLKTQTPGVVRP